MKKTIRHFLDKIVRYNQVVEDYRRATEATPDPALAYVNWGIDLAQSGQMDAAIEKFRQASEIAPHRYEPYLNWGVALARMNRVDEAIEKFKIAIEKDERVAGPYMLWGAALLEEGKLAEAQEKYAKAIELAPDNPEPYVNRGIAFARSGNYPAAIANFKQALTIHGYQPHVFFLWGVVLAEMQDYESAVEKFNMTLRFIPQHAEAYALLSVALNRLGRFKEALEKSRKALALNLEKPEVYLNQGDILANMGKLETAIVNYQQALALSPELAEAHLNWGVALCKLGQYAAGYEQFSKALSLDEKLPDLHRHWGHFLLTEQRYEESIPHLEKAAEATPDDISVLLDLSMALIKTERFQDAINLLFEIEKKDRWNPKVHYMLGTHFMGAGDLRKAASHFEKALEESPDFEDASINLALVLCELGDTVEAVRRMRPLIRKLPDSPRVNFFYGTILYRHGDYQEALAKYCKAIEVDSEYLEPRIGLGETYLRLGRLDEAEQALRDVLSAHPDSTPALFLLGMTLLRKGSVADSEVSRTLYQEARAFFERLVALEPKHWDAWANRAYLIGLLESVDAMNQAFEGFLTDAGEDLRAVILYYWSEALKRLGHADAASQKRQAALDADPLIETQMSHLLDLPDAL